MKTISEAMQVPVSSGQIENYDIRKCLDLLRHFQTIDSAELSSFANKQMIERLEKRLLVLISEK